jgi:hypothetical protein
MQAVGSRGLNGTGKWAGLDRITYTCDGGNAAMLSGLDGGQGEMGPER